MSAYICRSLEPNFVRRVHPLTLTWVLAQPTCEDATQQLKKMPKSTELSWGPRENTYVEAGAAPDPPAHPASTKRERCSDVRFVVKRGFPRARGW